MFKKTKPHAEHPALPTTDLQPAPSELKSLPGARQSTSVIGGKTQLRGDIQSDEDLTIEGQVTGTILCKQHTVKLGATGHLQGDAYAHTLRISGTVEGNLVALHKATIHGGAKVTGTITTPCLVLEDGSTFHGTIDMNPDNEVFKSVFADKPAPSSAPRQKKTSEATKAEDSTASA
ncbi:MULTISPECIES: bactofilin family protein [Halomonadaceae]|uniref:Polymer-forming cytoskeletal protein n=1 Tax=Vreelandella hamiltonii TaxID=502829 RepID=A0A8H9I2Y5_9GAMM|nr:MULTISPECIES: polymer-forming cytoskeletal protein [Halomonas]ATH78337.1 hypothetical protein CLM76_12405 [Halomonas hydrothermalis]KHJ50502.1 hypothetical protein PZ78_12665 [Halomonas hydrothermalis]GGW24298.1 hypothetical protein GCM10007157_14960 [Halomonas hamiltonii]